MAAEPNPKNFPVLSYVLARLPSFTAKSSSPSSSSVPPFDVEQPPPSTSHSIEIVTQMPHLTQPDVLASMTTAISDVAETRSILRTLGPRPDHESVDKARAKLSEIQSFLSESFEDIALTDAAAKDEKRRREMDQEKTWCESILKLDEVHASYEKLLKEAEERRVSIYESAEKNAAEDEENVAVVEVNEEVVGILQHASANPVDRVDLSDCFLKHSAGFKACLFLIYPTINLRGTAVTMKKMLETAFPSLDVILANYPPPAPKRLLAKVVPVAQMGVIGMIVAGDRIFPMIGIAQPPTCLVPLLEGQ